MRAIAAQSAYGTGDADDCVKSPGSIAPSDADHGAKRAQDSRADSAEHFGHAERGDRLAAATLQTHSGTFPTTPMSGCHTTMSISVMIIEQRHQSG